MLSPRTTKGIITRSDHPVIQEVLRVLNRPQAKSISLQRWVCEICGMLHTGTVPIVCDSCGSTAALVQQGEINREMNNLELFCPLD